MDPKITVEDWKAFLLDGFAPLEEIAEDKRAPVYAKQQKMRASADIADAIYNAPRTAYLVSRREMAQKMTQVFPRETNLSEQVSRMAAMWKKHKQILPLPTNAQYAWLRWFMLSDSAGVQNFYADLVKPFFDQIKQRQDFKLSQDFITYLTQLMGRAAEARVTGTNYGDDLDMYMNYRKRQQKTLVHKLRAYKRLYRDAVLDGGIDRDDAKAEGRRRLVKHAEERILDDPYLKQSTSAVQRRLLIQRLRNESMTRFVTDEQRKEYELNRMRDLFQYDPNTQLITKPPYLSSSSRVPVSFGKERTYLF